MKKMKFLALIMALIAMFTISVSASEADTSTVPDGESSSDTTSTTTTTTPFVPVGFSESIQTYNVEFYGLKFSAPQSLNCITVDSSSSELAQYSISLQDFINYNYVAYGVDTENSCFMAISVADDAYTQYIKDYSKLSSDELAEIVSQTASAYDSSTYEALYDSVDKVSINGTIYVKASSTSTSDGVTMVYTDYVTVVDGRQFTISMGYPANLPQDNIDTFVGCMDDLSFSSAPSFNDILLYCALGLAVLSIILLIIVNSSLRNKISSLQTEALDEDEESSDYFGITEETPENISQITETDADITSDNEQTEEMTESESETNTTEEE